jgi:Zn-dependent protease
MPNGTLLVARIGGTEIRLHWSMILILPYVFVAFRPTSVAGAVRAFLLVSLVFLFVLFHELGHTVVARGFGIRVPRVVLWPLGGAAMTEREAEKPFADLLIAAAGPLVNLIFGGLLFGLLFAVAAAGVLGAPAGFPDLLPRRSVIFLAATNIILAVTNLLPIYPLDGGRIFRALVSMLFGARRSNQATFWLSFVLGAGLLLGAFALHSLLLGLTALLLLAGAATLNQPLLMDLLRWYGRLFRRPEVFLRLADFDPALKLIEERIEADPRNPALYVQHGHIDYTLDDLLRAQANVDRALALAPDYLPAILLKGAVSYAMNNHAAAWACVRRAEQLRVNWAMNWLNRAILNRDAGQLDMAASDIQHAFDALTPGQPGSQVLIHLVRSSIVYRQGDHPSAIAEWERVYQLSSREAQIFTADRQHIFSKDWDWVTDYFAFLEAKNPNSVLIPLMRAEMSLRAGHWQQAVADYSRVLDEQPDYQDMRFYRGRAYEYLGRLDLAAADYRRAIQITRRGHVRRQAELRLSSLPNVIQA